MEILSVLFSLQMKLCIYSREMITPPSIQGDKCLSHWASPCVIQHCNPLDCASHQYTHLSQRFAWFTKRNHLSLCADWGAAVQTVIWTVSLNISPQPTWALPFCVITLVANYQRDPVAVENYSQWSFYALQITNNTCDIRDINLAAACPLLSVPCQCCWSKSPKIPAGIQTW